MLKIGEFSKLSQISIRSLRHYDKIDLFKPCTIHAENGYRYYSLDQLPLINQITAFKQMGFGLEEIRDLLHDDKGVDNLWRRLCQKRDEQYRILNEQHRRLNELDMQIQALEAHGYPQHPSIVMKSVPTQQVVAQRQHIPNGHYIGQIFRQLSTQLREQGASIQYFIGVFHANKRHFEHDPIPCYETLNGRQVFVHERPGGRDNDFEAVLLLDDAHKVMSRDVLPAMNPVASVMYQGCLDDRGMCYRVLDNWIDRQGYDLNGAIREIYYRVNGDITSTDNLIEIQFPIASSAH